MSNQTSTTATRPGASQATEMTHALQPRKLPNRSHIPRGSLNPSPVISAETVEHADATLIRRPHKTLLRNDDAHACTPAPIGPLVWTSYVTSSSRPSLALSKSISSTLAIRPSAPAIRPCVPAVRPSVPAQRAPRSAARAPSAAPVQPRLAAKQRFYPAQWRRVAQPAIDDMLRAYGRELQWRGWDRSLPCVLVPVQQLTRVMLDLLRLALRAGDARGANSDLRLSVHCQSDVVKTVVLALECEHAQGAHPLVAETSGRASINTPHIGGTARDRFHASDKEELERVRRLVQAFGGELSVSRGRRSSNVFYVAIPVDDRLTLVRRWLARDVRAKAVSTLVPQAATCGANDVPVRMFIVGCRPTTSPAALRAAEARLASLAGGQDFVYRAARGRWLWLTTNPGLPATVCGAEWLYHAVGKWNYPIGKEGQIDSHVDRQLFAARRIVAAMDAVLGPRVPPVDDLELEPARSRRPRIDRSSTLRPTHTELAARQGSLGTTSAKSPAPALAKQLRWRYPI